MLCLAESVSSGQGGSGGQLGSREWANVVPPKVVLKSADQGQMTCKRVCLIDFLDFWQIQFASCISTRAIHILRFSQYMYELDENGLLTPIGLMIFGHLLCGYPIDGCCNLAPK